MTDDDKKELKQELKQELLELDVSLRRKQEFWETPRNLTILIGITAAIAAVIGYWLGRASAPRSSATTPAVFGFEGFGNMHDTFAFIDGVQTAGILVIAVVLIYVVLRLEKAITVAAKRLKTMITKQQGLEEGIERVWKRVELIELMQRAQKTFIPTAELIDEIRSRLDALEGKNESPPINH